MSYSSAICVLIVALFWPLAQAAQGQQSDTVQPATNIAGVKTSPGASSESDVATANNPIAPSWSGALTGSW